MPEIDEAKLGEFMGRMVGHMTGGALCFGVWLGDELGLYRALASAGAQSADELAEATACHPRLVREWLDGQVAGGLIGYDAAESKYEISPEAAAALADDTSPVFVARGMNAFISLALDHEKIATAFSGDGALGWGDHHPCLFSGTEWFFRTGYRAYLPGAWLSALEGMDEKLQRGIDVADIGCGHGASAVVMTQAFPNVRVHGFDYHAPSIDTARKRAAEAGVADRTSFDVADAKGYDGTYQLICFFDCLYDMGDPVGDRQLCPRAPRPGRDSAPGRAVRDRRQDRQRHDQPDGGAFLHGLFRHLHPELAVAGGGTRRASGRGTLAPGLRRGRLHPVPKGNGDADESHPRGQAVRTRRLS
jgi:methylase of polypeptide subunit release factors